MDQHHQTDRQTLAGHASHALTEQRGCDASAVHAHIMDWETCGLALLMQRDETLYAAAQRALRRSRRLGLVTKRTQVAGIIAGARGKEDPWPYIQRAAALWRQP